MYWCLQCIRPSHLLFRCGNDCELAPYLQVDLLGNDQLYVGNPNYQLRYSSSLDDGARAWSYFVIGYNRSCFSIDNEVSQAPKQLQPSASGIAGPIPLGLGLPLILQAQCKSLIISKTYQPQGNLQRLQGSTSISCSKVSLIGCEEKYHTLHPIYGIHTCIVSINNMFNFNMLKAPIEFYTVKLNNIRNNSINFTLVDWKKFGRVKKK